MHEARNYAQRPRLLVAGTTHAIELIAEILGGQAELVPARSVREALERFDAQAFAAVVCNVRFDESRMFEFLQLLRERSASRCSSTCSS